MLATERQLKETKLSILVNLKTFLDLIDESEAIEYERSPRPSSGVSRRPSYPPSDPTSETALDVRRLGVRSARERGLKRLRELDSMLLDAVDDLSRACQRWQGEERSP